MKGLLTKEIYLACTSAVFLYVPVFIVLGLILKNPFFLTYIGVFFAVMPISLMSFDETSRWDRYVLGMPFSRRTIVTAKYAVTLILAAFACVIMLLMSLVLAGGGRMSLEASLPVMASSVALSLIFPTVLYPLNFKLGTTKARMAMLVLVGAVTGGMVLLSTRHSIIGDLTVKMRNTSPAVFCGIGAAVLLALFAASWALSVRFYTKREF